jgi:MoaA/NifB/PqqE/SkfB family radical SAM enzyme
MPINSEYDINNKWNPFNSFKLLGHADRWKRIVRDGVIPPPVLITIDPCNQCNISCTWCNAKEVIKNRSTALSANSLEKTADFILNWKVDDFRVEAVCIAGGGEPLLNNNIGGFIEKLIQGGIKVGVTTNGILIDRYISVLSKCNWVSISVDSGNEETYAHLKSTNPLNFEKIKANTQALIEYSKKHKMTLTESNPYQGVCWKYLICEENQKEIYSSAKIAHELGCRSIVYRPMGIPWHELNISQERKLDLQIINEQLNEAKSIEDMNFHVYSLASRFNDRLMTDNNFKKCYALFMTAYISPPYKGDDRDSAVVSLCCDWRGNNKLELKRDVTNFDDIIAMWGSEEHWKMHDMINPKDCPRCTYKPHNEIYEQVILKDTMSISFI